MAGKSTARKIERPRPTPQWPERWAAAKESGRPFHGGLLLERFLNASRAELKRWPHVFLLAASASYDDPHLASNFCDKEIAEAAWDGLEASVRGRILPAGDAFRRALTIQKRLLWFVGGLVALDPRRRGGGAAVPDSPSKAWAYQAILYAFGVRDQLGWGGRRLPASRNRKLWVPLTFLENQVISPMPKSYPRLCTCTDAAHGKHRGGRCGVFFRGRTKRARRCMECRT
jgi:hypothetical protein